MARILVITSSIGSIRLANAELARRLAVHGHDTEVLVAGDDVPDLLGRQHRMRVSPPTRGLGRSAVHASIGANGLEDARTALLDRAPDAVLVDIEQHEWVAVATTLGVPVGLTSVWVTPLRSLTSPPLDRHDPMPVGPRARIINVGHWAHRRTVPVRLRARAAIATRGADRLTVLRAFTRRHGIDLRDVVDMGAWLRPWAYRRLPILVFAPSEMNFEPEERLDHVGPMFVPVTDDSIPASIGTLLERPHDLVVYVGFGTLAAGYQDNRVRRVLDAAAQRPHWAFVFGLGGSIEPDSLGTLPDNVVALSWVPQRAVLARADVTVTHSGIATVMESIAADAPLVIYPGMRDQPGNGARVVHHRLGLRGEPGDGGAELVELIEAAHADQEIAVAITRMRSSFDRYAGAAEAVVDRMLAG
ncbi:MAG: hypothetical protein AAGD18_21615 [Actinomycetota bacterium]